MGMPVPPSEAKRVHRAKPSPQRTQRSLRAGERSHPGPRVGRKIVISVPPRDEPGIAHTYPPPSHGREVPRPPIGASRDLLPPRRVQVPRSQTDPSKLAVDTGCKATTGGEEGYHYSFGVTAKEARDAKAR